MKNAIILAGLSFIIADTSFAQTSHKQLVKELDAIEMNESSGGIYKNHVLMKHGMHKNMRAGGAYGIMPLTVRTILKWSKRIRAKYPELETMTNSEITRVLTNNAELDRDLALTHWKRLRVHLGLTPERAAYSWFNGWGEVHAMTDDEVQDHWYVQRFVRHLEPRRSYAHAKSR